METKQKLFRLTARHIEMLEEIKKKYNLVSDSEAVRYIISEFYNNAYAKNI